MSRSVSSAEVVGLLGIVGDLLRGGRHSRRTIASATGKSLPTADRWIEQIATELPGIRRAREGKTSWISYDARRSVPSKPAVVGACVAASLAVIFEGTQHERNLKDARDYLLQLRGVAYEDLDRKFFFAPRGGEYALPESAGELDEIIDTLLDGRMLHFDYRRNSGERQTLTVQPLSLVIFEHQFYVMCRRKDASFYCYRFVRMSNITGLKETCSYPAKSEYNPRTVFAPVFGIHLSNTSPVREVEIRLSGPWANFALEHRWHETQQTSRLDEGTVSVRLRVRVCPELETWVLGFGEAAVVVRPSELVEAITGRLRRAAANYAARDERPSLAKGTPTTTDTNAATREPR